MPLQPKVEVIGLTRAKKAFVKLLDNVEDLKPVWVDFLEYYKGTYIPSVFDSRGKALGSRWDKFSPEYLKKKRKISSKPMMRLSDRLFNAATGGSGWVESLENKSFSFGIEDSIKYAAVHQYGGGNNIPQRAYLFTKNDDLSPRSWAVLLTLAENHIVKGVE